MAKGRDKQGREQKKKKKAKASGQAPDVEFRHHSVVMNQPQPATPRTTE